MEETSMKMSSLKTSYAMSIVLFFILYGTTTIQMVAAQKVIQKKASTVPRQPVAHSGETKPVQTIEQSITVLLEECFDISNKQSFVYFIDQLVILVENNQGALHTVIKDPKIKNKGQFIHDFVRQLKKIRNLRDARSIGQSLLEYKIFMPEILRNKGSRELLKILEYRLSC